MSSINGINLLDLYGLNQVQPAGVAGMQQNYGGNNNLSVFSGLFGSGQQTDMFDSSALGGFLGAGSGNIDPQAIRKAIDTNGDGIISQQEITAFLCNPTTAIQKAGLANQQGGSNSILQTMLPLLMQLMGGQKENAAATKANTANNASNSAAITQLQSQLNTAIQKSEQLTQQVTDQNKKVEDTQKAVTQAQADVKAATAKANAANQALVDFKISHDGEDPKRFANEFAQLLNTNKDAAISRDEFKTISKAAGDDAKINKQEWDKLVEDSKLADEYKADLKAQVAEAQEIDAKGLEDQFFENDTNGDGKVSAGSEIESFGKDVAANDGDASSVKTGELEKESFEVPPAA